MMIGHYFRIHPVQFGNHCLDPRSVWNHLQLSVPCQQRNLKDTCSSNCCLRCHTLTCLQYLYATQNRLERKHTIDTLNGIVHHWLLGGVVGHGGSTGNTGWWSSFRSWISACNFWITSCSNSVKQNKRRNCDKNNLRWTSRVNKQSSLKGEHPPTTCKEVTISPNQETDRNNRQQGIQKENTRNSGDDRESVGDFTTYLVWPKRFVLLVSPLFRNFLYPLMVLYQQFFTLQPRRIGTAKTSCHKCIFVWNLLLGMYEYH